MMFLLSGEIGKCKFFRSTLNNFWTLIVQSRRDGIIVVNDLQINLNPEGVVLKLQPKNNITPSVF